MSILRYFRRGASLTIALCLALSAVPASAGAKGAKAQNPFAPALAYDTDPNAHALLSKGALPSQYDSRAEGLVTGVKAQLSDGTCWVFSSTAALESLILKRALAEAQTLNLSEDHAKAATLMNFKDGKNDGGMKHTALEGGNMDDMTAYWTRGQGPVSEAGGGYPSGYIEGVGKRTKSQVQKGVQAYSVEDTMWLNAKPADALTTSQRTQLFTQIKQSIMDYGAVYTAIYVDASRQFTPYIYENSNTDQNHAVAIVGWDDNFSRKSFSPAAPIDGAFIIKNSWGAIHGDGGYFYVSYADRIIGSYSSAVTGVSKADRNLKLYQHDALTASYFAKYSWMGAQYKAAEQPGYAERIERVSFYTRGPNVSYEVYLARTGMSQNGTGYVSGGKTRLAAGQIAKPGYHTVSIPGDALVSGEFCVLVKLKAASGTKDLVALEQGGADGKFGESFVSVNGSTWKDAELSHIANDYGDVCLKVKTRKVKGKAPKPEPKATGVALDGSSFVRGVGETFELAVCTRPVEAIASGIEVTSSNPTVVKVVDKNKAQLTARHTGTATITVKTKSGKSVKCGITVRKAPDKLSYKSSKLRIGERSSVKYAAQLPKNTGAAITYSSSNSRICVVQKDGTIIGIKPGKATVTARTFNGKTAKCTVTVYMVAVG